MDKSTKKELKTTDIQRARMRAYYQRNRDIILKDRKEYRLKNKEKLSVKHAEYRMANKDEIREKGKIYRAKTRVACSKRSAKYQKEQMKCPKFRAVHSLRARMANAIKRGDGKKTNNSIDLVGCTWEEIRTHLESQFTEGMTWANYGEWHIDHIKPCAQFDLTIDTEQRECFNYSNLQPLWAEDNLRKSDSYEKSTSI